VNVQLTVAGNPTPIPFEPNAVLYATSIGATAVIEAISTTADEALCIKI
jgi:hypothetical protein